MGFLDNIKAAKAMYDDGQSRAEHWARIVSVEPGRLGGTKIEIEVHQGGQPPERVPVSGKVPKGVTPQVGQDVDYKETRWDESSRYEILWGQPARYGPAGPPAT